MGVPRDSRATSICRTLPRSDALPSLRNCDTSVLESWPSFRTVSILFVTEKSPALSFGKSTVCHAEDGVFVHCIFFPCNSMVNSRTSAGITMTAMKNAITGTGIIIIFLVLSISPNDLRPFSPHGSKSPVTAPNRTGVASIELSPRFHVRDRVLLVPVAAEPKCCRSIRNECQTPYGSCCSFEAHCFVNRSLSIGFVSLAARIQRDPLHLSGVAQTKNPSPLWQRLGASHFACGSLRIRRIVVPVQRGRRSGRWQDLLQEVSVRSSAPECSP